MIVATSVEPTREPLEFSPEVRQILTDYSDIMSNTSYLRTSGNASKNLIQYYYWDQVLDHN